MRSTVPVLPAIGDAEATVTAGDPPDVDVIVVERPFAVFRRNDSERVFSFASRARAEDVARQIGGLVKGPAGRR